MRQLDGITDSVDVNLGKLREMVKKREDEYYSPWGHKELEVTWWLNKQLLYLLYNSDNNAWEKYCHVFSFTVLSRAFYMNLTFLIY